MKDFIRQRLHEAIKSYHWKFDSYPDRIENSTFSELPIDHKIEVDKRIAFIEGLEFSEAKPQKLGVWIYTSPKTIDYSPYRSIDKGHFLLGIINNNNMTTLYWKYKKEGQYDFDVTFEELVELTNSKYYDPENNPISIESIEAFRNAKRQAKKQAQKPKREKFKKVKLTDGSEVKYYETSNRFETMDNQPIKVDDIFDKLPEELQDKVMELLEAKKNQ
jgi:hypothetical protein